MSIQWKYNYNLEAYNTFGLAVEARRFAHLKEEEDLAYFFRRARAPGLLLGGGSNVLFVSDTYEEVVVNVLRGKEVLREEGEEVLLAVMSGERWHDLVLWTLERGWYGLENLSFIPGTVGAAPIQNIGAYGVELASVLEEVVVREWATGKRHRVSREACELGYRDSIFKRAWRGRYFIEQVVLRLSKRPEVHLSYVALRQMLERWDIRQPRPEDVSRAVIAIRRSKLPDPKELGNAGSFFKNPVLCGLAARHWLSLYPDAPHYVLDFDELGQPQVVKVAAAWLIEQCGWKGVRRGAVGVHAQQALVLVHYGGGCGADLLALSEEISASVRRRFGVDLEREVRVV